MAISLSKGQKIDLTKGKVGLSNIRVGLGWDQVKKSGGGMFGGIFGGSGGSGADIDIDASVLMVTKDGKVNGKGNVIYFGNLNSSCGSVHHTGDNRTGAGEGDDEVIKVELTRVPENIDKLVFVVNIYNASSKKQHFGMIENAFIRVIDERNGEELIRFNLTDNFEGKKAVFVGEIYRNGSDWKFNAVGEGTGDNSIMEMASRYR